MHPAALTPDGKKLFPRLAAFESFYLGGGTALALQIGHRVSEDFDLFSDRTIKRTQLRSAERVFQTTALRPTVNNRDQLTVFVGQVKVTFLHYPFPVLQPFVISGKLRLLSVAEVAATKAYTIGRRGTLKDYVDLCFAMRHGVSLKAMIALAKRKYRHAFNARLFLEQLLYMDDVEEMPIRFLRRPMRKSVLADFFSKAVRAFKL